VVLRLVGGPCFSAGLRADGLAAGGTGGSTEDDTVARVEGAAGGEIE